jgi:hypothetical protein
VASNALAAVIYWCQGKTSCSFDTTIIKETPVKAKDFFVARYRESQNSLPKM